LQHKIYYHTGKNKIGLVRHYQHKLVKSIGARLLSVKLVSQGNKEKVTAGIDRRIYSKDRTTLIRIAMYFYRPETLLSLHNELDFESKRTGIATIKFTHPKNKKNYPVKQ